MRRLQTWVALFVVFSVTACSTGRDELVAGRQYEDLIQPGNQGEQVPLPPGKWILVAWDIYPNEQELGGVLIATEGRHVSRLIDFYVSYITVAQPRRLGLSPYKFCGRNDILYTGKSDDYGTGMYRSKGSPQDCWGINHWPMTFSGSVPKHLLGLRDYVEANGLVMPSTMIAAQYRRGGDDKFFALNYYFNPELEGIPPPQQVDWRTGDWHRDRAFRDPAKKAYIEKLIRWGETWHEQVDRGFKGQLR